MTHDNIRLHILNLTVTLRCSLNCKLCVADVPHYSPSPHFEVPFLENCIDKCFEIADYVERFQISGGEPLVHKGLSLIVKKAMTKSDQFGFLGIFTNGTIFPSNELMNVILSYDNPEKFMFYISNYGEYSPQVAEIVKMLESYKIPVDIKDYSGDMQHYGGWVDYGSYQHQERSMAETEEIFRKCAVNSMGGVWSCRFGQIHRCTRSASGMSLGLIPDEPLEYIDLFEEKSISDQKTKLCELSAKTTLKACEYCSGHFGSDSAPRYPAAEQIERKK